MQWVCLQILKNMEQKTGNTKARSAGEIEAIFSVQNIGLALKAARTKAKMTQSELAEKAGLNRILISKIERNKSVVPISTLVKIVEKGLSGRIDISIVV